MTQTKAEFDTLQRFIFENAPVRGEFVQLNKTFQTIIEQHPYPEPVKKLLGEALCVASLLSAVIKFNGRLTVQFRGKGKLGLLLAQCDNQFHMRGLAKFSGDLTYDELMESFKDGILMIMLDAGPGKQQYEGVVEWRGNSLAESIEGYFKYSEQLATKLWLTVHDSFVTGLLLQIVPGTERNLEVPLDEFERIAKVTRDHLANSNDILGLDYHSLLYALYPNDEIRLFPSTQVSFKCTCTRKRGEDAIGLLGKAEAEEEIKDKHTIVVTCDFCNKEYLFDRQDVDKIFSDKPSDKHLH